MGYFQVLLISLCVTKISAISSHIKEENGEKSNNTAEMEGIRLNRHLMPHVKDLLASPSELISTSEEVFSLKNYSETSSKLMALEDGNHPVVTFRENFRPRLMGIWKMYPNSQQQGENTDASGKDNIKKLASIVESRSFITNPELSFHIKNSPESRDNFKNSKHSERRPVSKEYSSFEGRDKNSEALLNSNENSGEIVSDYGQMLPKDYKSNIEKLAEDFIKNQNEKNGTEMEGKKTQVDVKNADKNKSYGDKTFVQSKGRDRTKFYDNSEKKFSTYNSKNTNKNVWDSFNKNPVQTKLLSDPDSLYSSEKRPPLSEENYKMQNQDFESDPLYSREKLSSIEEYYSKSPILPPEQNAYTKFQLLNQEYIPSNPYVLKHPIYRPMQNPWAFNANYPPLHLYDPKYPVEHKTLKNTRTSLEANYFSPNPINTKYPPSYKSKQYYPPDLVSSIQPDGLKLQDRPKAEDCDSSGAKPPNEPGSCISEDTPGQSDGKYNSQKVNVLNHHVPDNYRHIHDTSTEDLYNQRPNAPESPVHYEQKNIDSENYYPNPRDLKPMLHSKEQYNKDERHGKQPIPGGEIIDDTNFYSSVMNMYKALGYDQAKNLEDLPEVLEPYIYHDNSHIVEQVPKSFLKSNEDYEFVSRPIEVLSDPHSQAYRRLHAYPVEPMQKKFEQYDKRHKTSGNKDYYTDVSTFDVPEDISYRNSDYKNKRTLRKRNFENSFKDGNKKKSDFRNYRTQKMSNGKEIETVNFNSELKGGVIKGSYVKKFLPVNTPSKKPHSFTVRHYNEKARKKAAVIESYQHRDSPLKSKLHTIPKKDYPPKNTGFVKISHGTHDVQPFQKFSSQLKNSHHSEVEEKVMRGNPLSKSGKPQIRYFNSVKGSHLKNTRNQRLISASVPIPSSVEYNVKGSELHQNDKAESQYKIGERTPSAAENPSYSNKSHERGRNERHHLYKKVRRETDRTSNPKQSKMRKLNRRDDYSNGQKATYHWGLEKHKNIDGFFQYANVPHAQEFEYGYRVGGPEHTHERHHRTEGKHSTIKLNWNDKNGDFGDQYWEFNHDSAESDSKHATNDKTEKAN